jgi:hypothetical protein
LIVDIDKHEFICYLKFRIKNLKSHKNKKEEEMRLSMPLSFILLTFLHTGMAICFWVKEYYILYGIWLGLAGLFVLCAVVANEINKGFPKD